MKKEVFSKMSDEELVEMARNNKPKPIIDAFFIGFLIGIPIYGLVADNIGFIALIPLFLIYLFLKKPKQYRALQEELKKRKMK